MATDPPEPRSVLFGQWIRLAELVQCRQFHCLAKCPESVRQRVRIDGNGSVWPESSRHKGSGAIGD